MLGTRVCVGASSDATCRIALVGDIGSQIHVLLSLLVRPFQSTEEQYVYGVHTKYLAAVGAITVTRARSRLRGIQYPSSY